jgi:pimeloyl-ACP methyl ester carboxylesterase
MATPLILLPGMMCDARLFAPQIAQFSPLRPVSVPQFSGVSIEQIARQVLADAPPRFALAGLSMGGIVAMEILSRAPDRVERLALVDTNARAERPEVASRRDRQIADVRAGGLLTVMRDEMKPNYLADGPDKPGLLALCSTMATDLGPQAFEDQSRALQARPDQRPRLGRIHVPTLVMCGAKDSLCPPAYHHEIAGLIPGALLQIVPNAGHLPVLEAPGATNAALASWLTL